MKPQAMGSQEFFLALCRELGLSPSSSDEETIVRAVGRASRRSEKLSKMSKEAMQIWEALPPGTELPDSVHELLRWLIKS